MASSIIKNESQLLSTRLLNLPNTFIVDVFIRQPIVNVHLGGNNTSLYNSNLIQNGGEDNILQFNSKVEKSV